MSGGLAGCFTVSRHVCHFSSLHLVPLVAFFWGVWVVFVLVCFFWGALDGFFLTSSSRDMTATVLSNAALEKKMLCLFFRSVPAHLDFHTEAVKLSLVISYQ